jgi:RND family efflux transporter MFP subunit
MATSIGPAAVRGAALLAALVLASCSRNRAAEPAPPPPPVRLGAENVATVERRVVERGPTFSGTLRPRKAATVRAQQGGQLVESVAEVGVRVRRGQLLARIQDAAVADLVEAAEHSVRSATRAAEVARRNEERARTLAAAGALAARDAEVAEAALATAEAGLADARARAATAGQLLSRLELRAPFDGVVEERHASAGDLLQPGAPLCTIIDPSSLRLEGFVPADVAGDVHPGAGVELRVTGHGDQTFTGRVEGVGPSVDRGTGQVRVFVELPNARTGLVAGLFARGRIAGESRPALVVPEDAVDARTAPPSAVRVIRGRLERVPVTLGLRDESAEVVEVSAGLAEGDVVLRASGREAAADDASVVLPEGRRELARHASELPAG